jgi:hypothetical protein
MPLYPPSPGGADAGLVATLNIRLTQLEARVHALEVMFAAIAQRPDSVAPRHPGLKAADDPKGGGPMSNSTWPVRAK